MAKNSVKYDAFISYRHSEPDSFAAAVLHKQLESFKLPRGVAKNQTKTKIERVFRDREELPLVTNLADPITEALQNSEYLIVICSPRLPESMWCRKEIETFIGMHDREHVLAVLVEGEPDNSFPEELLYREVKETQADGSVVIRRIPVEPLAADVRGRTRREIRKKIKSELLRLVAPMFDCNYDELKQRHKEQRTRKMMLTAMSVSAVCLLFGLVSGTMALRIQHQNTQIKAQSEEIMQQSEEIMEQSEELEKQYQAAKRNTAVSRAREAAGYLEEGDRIRAVATAQDALLDLYGNNRIEEDAEYPAEAVYALTDSLYLYENGQQILPDRMLTADTAVRAMQLSPEGSRIVTVEASGQTAVWQPGAGDAPINVHTSHYLSDKSKMVAFLGEDCLFAPVDDEVVLYDLSQGEAVPIYRIACADYAGIIVMQEARQAVLLSESGYQIIACSDGSILYTGQWEADGRIARATSVSAVSEDGRYWAVALASDYTQEEESRCVVVCRADGERLNKYEIAYEYVESMRFDGERLYVVSNHSGEMDTTQVTLGMEGRLQAFDIRGAETPVWTYERHNGWLYETSYAHMEDSNYLLCSGYSDVVALDKRDGSYVDIFAFGVEVVKLGNYSGSDNFIAFTRDGVWHYLSMKRREDMVGNVFPACTSANVMEFAIGDGYCVTLPYNSRKLTIYRTARGEGLEEVYRGEHSYREAVYSTDGAYMAVSYFGDNYMAAVELFDTGSGELLWHYEDDARYEAAVFFDYNGQETLALLTGEHLLVLDLSRGSVLERVPIECEGTFQYIAMMEPDIEKSEEAAKGQRYFFWRDDEMIYGYDLNTMDYAYKVPFQEAPGYNDVVAVAEDLMYFAVVDKENGALRFGDMEDGETFYTYGEDGVSQTDDINTGYIETMFFDEGAAERHLFVVYMDGRIMRLDVEDDMGAAQFCTADSHDANPEKYNGLYDVMRSYTGGVNEDYAVLQGNTDAYLLTKSDGDILAHMHGFLGYDSVNGQVYLTNNGTIYRLPLYTLPQINEFASAVRQTAEGSDLF